MRQVIEYPILVAISDLTYPDVRDISKNGRAIGGNRHSAFEFHYVYDAATNCEEKNRAFYLWLENLGQDTYRIYGIFQYDVYQFRIDKLFMGFSIYFSDVEAAGLTQSEFTQFSWTKECASLN